MVKRTMSVFLVMLLVAFSANVYAGAEEQEQAKKDLAKLDQVKTYVKTTVVPLLNCFVTHHNQLQFMKGDYPNQGRSAASAMDQCLMKHASANVDDQKAMDLKNKVVNLIRSDIQVGRQYCDSWEAMNRIKAELAAKPKRQKKLQPQIDDLNTKLGQMKQSLSKHTGDFQQVQKDYKAFNADFIKRYVEVRDAASGKKK